MIKLNYTAQFYGLNPYAPSPVLVAELILPAQALEQAEQRSRQLVQLYPHWLAESDSGEYSVPGSLVAHLTSQWALAALNEVRGFLHHAGGKQVENRLLFWLEFHHPIASRKALELALKVMLQGLAPTDIKQDLEQLWILCRQYHPDYQARILMQAAQAKQIPYLPFLPEMRLWQFGWGANSRVFMESSCNEDGKLGSQISASKEASKALFRRLGAPTPQHRLVNTPDELHQAIQALGYPCVTKPLNFGGGKGVTANIQSPQALQEGFNAARRFSKGPVMVETFVPGDDYRLMVIKGQVVAAIRREPSSVQGDGRSTVRQLVAQLNQSRSNNIVKSRYLRPIPYDKTLEQHLASQGLTLDSVVPDQQAVTLRSNANLSTGGVCHDVSSQLHPDIKKMAEALASSFGIANIGLDYITTDISKSWRETSGTFIEINTTPGLDAMIAAGIDPVSVGSLILGEQLDYIPVHLRLVPHNNLQQAIDALQQQASVPGHGWAGAGQAYLSGIPLQIPTTFYWSHVLGLLQHQTLTALTLVCSLEELEQYGLPVKRISQLDVDDAVMLPQPWHKILSQALQQDDQPRYVDSQSQ